MRSLVAQIRKELKAYFDQPTGYVLLVLFVGVASLLFFRGALGTNEASLRPMFTIMPVLLLVFVPAATMRLVAEEQRDGTLEILLTHPIRTWSVIFAKFLSALVFVGIGIVFTLGIPLGIATAGDLDQGAAIAQYLGTLFLMASFVAIGLFTSSLTRNQIVAFISAFVLIALLTLAGAPFVTVALPSRVAILLQDLSPLTHFSGITRGVLDLRDVLYFVALISTFLSATYLMIRGKSVSHHSPLYLNLRLGVGGLVVISLVVGWFGSSIQGRWDLTEKKLYTLSPATQEILDGLDDIVTINLYASKDPPVQIAAPTREVNHLLDDLASRSDGKVRIVRKFPDQDDQAAIEAQRSFVPTRAFNIERQGELQIKRGYLGMGMTYTDRQEVIPFVDSLGGLEYEVVSTLYRVSQKTPKTVAFLKGHGELRRDAELQSFRNALEQHHDVIEADELETGTLGLDTVDVLIVAGPTEEMKLVVAHDFHEFLSMGGKALVLIDPVTVDQRGMRGEPNRFSFAEELEVYGVKAHPNVVFDMGSNEDVTFSGRFAPVTLPYPYWVRVPAVEGKISGGAGSAVFPWASSLEIIEPSEKTVEVEVTPLLETRPTAGFDWDYQDISPTSPFLTQVVEEDLNQRLLAVALTGTRCPEVEPKCEKDPDRPFRMIIAGDSSWIGENMVTDNQYQEHINLASNWIDWLTQDDALATIRGKGLTLRELLFESDAHRNLVQYVNIVGVPALIVLIGLLRFVLRRNDMRKVYAYEG